MLEQSIVMLMYTLFICLLLRALCLNKYSATNCFLCLVENQARAETGYQVNKRINEHFLKKTIIIFLTLTA